MIKIVFEKAWTGNWENAFHGLRHPFESYSRSDSRFGVSDSSEYLYKEIKEVVSSYDLNEDEVEFDKKAGWLVDNGEFDDKSYVYLGKNDLDLAQRMIKAGTPNDKFLRQIFVSVDITAPLYLLKELDTYKVATVANSTSTMHKLASTPITKECFEMDDYDGSLKVYDREPYNIDDYVDDIWDSVICHCETLRQRYVETKDKRYWKELIRILPESWLQTRTFTCNYSVLRNIIHWRKGHLLTEWHSFIDWCKTLPYAEELLFFDN